MRISGIYVPRYNVHDTGCVGSWHHERSLTHCPSSLGWATGVLLFHVCCVCDFDVCICLFVWVGLSETSFLLFLHLFFAGVL